MQDSYHDLEYSVLKRQIELLCHSDLGRAEAAKMQPMSDLAKIKAELTLHSQSIQALKDGIEPRLEDLNDPVPLFGIESGVFGYEEFFLFYQNAAISAFVAPLKDSLVDLPQLKKLWQRIVPLPQIRDRFNAIFDAEGEVQDGASPELKRIRKRFSQLRGNITKTMNEMLSDQKMDQHLMDKFFTHREDRYVLPIKESSAKLVDGIVQSHSGSGSTVFIEPQSIVPLNNELQLIKQDEKKEIYRIFSEFSQQIRDLEQEFVSNTEVLTRLDFLFATARLGVKLDSQVPQLQASPVLELKNARHPLLSLQMGLKKVIPFDLELSDKRVLVLSGPNTGGKTVLMKAVGLISLMVLSGLPAPLDPDSKIGIFDHIYADIGDDQSIEAALSTFSSHIGKIKTMLDNATKDSLVLIDEIGAATDPEQGSALAQAILEQFANLGCHTIVTTHYTSLKIFAESHPQALNASMQFNLEGMSPNYRFVTGFPSDSFAIEVAASLGLEEDLIQRAKSLSGTQNREFTELLHKMQEEKKSLARESYQHRLKRRTLELRIEELEAKNEAFEQELKQRKQKFIKELQDELSSQQKIYQRELEELKRMDKEQRKNHSEKKIRETSDKIQELDAQIKAAAMKHRSAVYKPKVGDKVWISSLDADAIIMEIKDEVVTVDMNGIGFKTSLDTVFESKEEQQSKPEPKHYGRETVSNKAAYELMLLGLTFDEARPMIDKFIDDAVISGLHKLRIVHGKGSGALRAKTRAYLKRKKQVISFETPPYSEGGDGVTVVTV
ncbi:MAG: endonuclease MutS2 [Candidatus Cloacimonadaceae bacterium]|jgi:DNA mismatch repair protein MutS2